MPEIHGRYDSDNDIMYINGKAETSLEWAFWHEAFHLLKKHEPELYEDIRKYVERHKFFGSHQIEEYKKAVKQPTLSDTKVEEEMLADAFADMKTGRRIVEKMSEEKPSVAQKFLAFTKKLVEGVKKFFKSKEVKEKYPEVALTNGQFKNFVERIDENVGVSSYPIATVYLKDIDRNNKRCELCIFTSDDEEWNTESQSMAIKMLLEKAFKEYGMHKVYSYVFY